jgi:hypothetical protein
VSYDKYGRDESESAAYSRRMVDYTAWTRREVLDPAGDLDFESWCQRQRMRDKAAGTPTTEAELNAEMDRMFPGTGRQSRRGRDAAEALEAQLKASRMPPPGAATEIGRPTRPGEF